MTKPHVDKLQEHVWMFQEPDEYVFNHPSQPLDKDSKVVKFGDMKE